jgi:molybdate transport system substrate-binding protein
LKALLLATVFALASIFLVACGDDGDTAATATPTAVASASMGSTDAAPTTAHSSLSGNINVFAASSLTDAFNEIAKSFEKANPDADVAFNFAGSSALRTQIEEGAPADVFASANTDHMDALVHAKLANAPELFVHNSLTIITPKDNPAGIQSLADLKEPGIKLVLAAEEVPVGGYARDMLKKVEADPTFGAGFSDAVLANLVSNESNVKQVVAKIQLGEGDVGIVYGSDVTPDVAPDLNSIDVPGSQNVIADYPIATLTEADNAEVAQAFVDYVLSSAGQDILQKWGFQPVN